MIHKEYLILKYWYDANSDIFYLYGVRKKEFIRLTILETFLLFLALISILLNLENLVYLFASLLVVTMPIFLYFISKYKLWFSYNKNNNKTLNIIYSGDKIPEIIYEITLIRKKEFIERSGFYEK